MFPQRNYHGPNVVPIIQQREQTVQHIVPGIFTGILAGIQLILCIVIVILEIVSVYYDAGRGTIYAGFWCSIIFFITCISMFFYLCCGRSNRWKNYLIVQNIINLIFVIILLSFTSSFINDPCLCYGALCCIPDWGSLLNRKHYDDYSDSDEVYECTGRTFRKIPALKGLLACAVLMLICNIVYIATYTIVSLYLRMKAKSNAQELNVMYHQQENSLNFGEQSSREESYRHSPSQQHPPSAPVPTGPSTPVPMGPSAPVPTIPSAPPPPYEMVVDKF